MYLQPCAYHSCKLFFKWLTRSVPLQDVKLQPLPHLSDKNHPRELLQVIGKFVVCTEVTFEHNYVPNFNPAL
jgi:hypothetical protein